MKTDALFQAGNALRWLSAYSGSSASRTEAAESPMQKRLREMQEGLTRLEAQAAAQNNPRQAALARIALLRRRLETLRGMLQFASPKQAAALAAELRNIAGELAAAARVAGNAPANSPTSSPTPVSADAASAPPPETATASDTGTKASDGTPSDSATANPAATTNSAPPPAANNDAAEERALHDALNDVKKLLKEVLHQIKAKLATAPEQAKRDLRAAEKSADDIGKALAAGNADGLYLASGSAVNFNSTANWQASA